MAAKSLLRTETIYVKNRQFYPKILYHLTPTIAAYATWSCAVIGLDNGLSRDIHQVII